MFPLYMYYGSKSQIFAVFMQFHCWPKNIRVMKGGQIRLI